MKAEKIEICRSTAKENLIHFKEDLREAVMVYRTNLCDAEKKDLEARISCLIEDLNYL